MAAGGFGSTTDSASSQALIEQKLRAEQIVKNGAGWFLAIGGLSILNSVLTMSGTHFTFIFGLGTTRIVDAIERQSGTTGSTLGLIVNLFIAGIFVGFWNFARNGGKWAFLTGMALYAIDGLILLPFKIFLALPSMPMPCTASITACRGFLCWRRFGRRWRRLWGADRAAVGGLENRQGQ